MKSCLLGFCFIVLSNVAASTDSDTLLPKQKDKIDWHIVEKGESLSSITKKYLGTSQRWRDNLDLNPNITNADLIHPGQRLQIIVGQQEIEPEPIPEPEIESELEPVQEAVVTEAYESVDKKHDTSPWSSAIVGDRLYQNDGLRTLANSSAELTFNERSSMKLTEYSQVFLRRSEAYEAGMEHNTIEVEQGSVDLEIRKFKQDDATVEVLVGDANVRPELRHHSDSHTRAKRGNDTQSQVMVYSGNTDVEASGVIVSVLQGMGTQISAGQPPSKPEWLLAAPVTDSPKLDTVVAPEHVQFQWSPVNEASNYTLEVCADAECSQLVLRNVAIQENYKVVEKLPQGPLYWRVTPVSVSGLDGFASDVQSFHVQPAAGFTFNPWLGLLAVLVLFGWIALWLLRRRTRATVA